MSFNTSSEIEKHLGGCHPVVARILFERGIRDIEQLTSMIKPELSKLPEATSLYNMERAARRAANAIEKGERITVYGDYDVDGTCGSALLLDFFEQLGISIATYQPDRFKEGYGVHTKAIERLIDEDHAELIITVDCGITAVEPARAAASRGVDMIILDHHQCGSEFPSDAYAVVNPQQPLDDSGLKNLCGTGIAFFFCVALRAELRRLRYFTAKGLPEPNLKQLLDLVAVATVADMMDVRGVNRILLSHGLQVLKKSPRIGLKAILETAGIKNPTATHCGFVIGPRINAAGRLQHASAALDLLTSDDEESAHVLATQLDVINNERKSLQEKVVEGALKQAHEQILNPMWDEIRKTNPECEMGPWPRALVLHSHEWHEGVLGIAASRVVEEFSRPVFILGVKEGTDVPTLKGSARSMPKIDILAAVAAKSVSENLLNFGGHAHAGGVTLLESKCEDFLIAVNMQLALTTTADQYVRERRHDAEVSLTEITPRLMQELEALAPFGMGFPEPVLKVRGSSSKDVKVLKDKHLKMTLLHSKESFANTHMDAIWFNGVTSIDINELKKSQNANFWVKPEWNEWQGSKRLQLRITHAEV